MSSDDRQEPQPIWQDRSSTYEHWERSSQQAAPEEDPEPFYSSRQQQQQIEDEFPLLEEEVEDVGEIEGAEEPEALVASDDPWQRIWFYVRLLLLPVLFGGVAALLILPPIANGSAHLPLSMFWPMLIIIVAIAGAQVVLTHYTSTWPNIGVLVMLAGFLVLLLLGIFAVFGPLPGGILLVATIGLGFYLVRRIFHPVPEGHVDIVFVQGRYYRTLSAGFNLLWPWEKVVAQVSVKETLWHCPPQRIQLSVDDDVTLRALVSYQVLPEDAHLAITQVNDWELSLREQFVTTLQQVAATFQPGDFVSWSDSFHAYQEQRQFAEDNFTTDSMRREQINQELHQHCSDRCASWGVQINGVDIREIRLVPHEIPILETDYPDTDALHMEEQRDPHEEPTQVLQPAERVPALAGVQSQASGVAAEVPRPSTLPPPVNPAILKEEVLVKAYEQVKSGKVTDPASIRNIAASFEAVARDPKASASVNFDAERAAQNLYEQARKYEDQSQGGTIHDDVTRPNWNVPPSL